MDVLTLAMAKAYADSKQLVHVEPGKVLTYDGDKTSKPIVNDMFVKISDTVINIDAIESITIGSETITKENFKCINLGPLSAILMDDLMVVGSFTKDTPFEEMFFTKGVWVKHDVSAYVSKVVLAETIVPIDQKYLPGTTKVFKLQDYGIDLVTMVLGGQTKVEQDNSVLITAVNNAVSAGMIPMVILHEMMPAHCFVNYAYVNGEIGFSGYLRDGEIVSRIDVAITNGAVFVFPTVLGA